MSLHSFGEHRQIKNKNNSETIKSVKVAMHREMFLSNSINFQVTSLFGITNAIKIKLYLEFTCF